LADSTGTPVFSTAALTTLHNAVLGACDGLDGLVDGQIEDPRACRYDPVAVQCPGTADCLTPAQVATARTLYEGPKDDHGRRLYPGWESRGSELAWDGLSFLAPLPDNYLRYVGYPIGAPHSSVAEFRFTVDELNRLTAEGRKGNALSLDLSAFRRAGGKLILWHGFDDQSIPAVGTLDYYGRLVRRNGGLRETQRFARTFLVPTAYHCFTGGYSLNEFDALPALVDWVEHGAAPDRIIANRRAADGSVTRTRPVFPYPLRAAYDGSGSVDDAANFVPAPPLVSPAHDVIDWAGSYLHDVPGPVAR
jgi:feruloyl esterase